MIWFALVWFGLMVVVQHPGISDDNNDDNDGA